MWLGARGDGTAASEKVIASAHKNRPGNAWPPLSPERRLPVRGRPILPPAAVPRLAPCLRGRENSPFSFRAPHFCARAILDAFGQPNGSPALRQPTSSLGTSPRLSARSRKPHFPLRAPHFCARAILAAFGHPNGSPAWRQHQPTSSPSRILPFGGPQLQARHPNKNFKKEGTSKICTYAKHYASFRAGNLKGVARGEG